MKKFFPFSWLLFIVIAFGIACSKNENDPTPPPPVVKADTLTAGWTKGKMGDQIITDIFFQNNSVGYALGPILYKTTNGGITWDSIYPGSKNYSVNLSVTPNGNVFFLKSDSAKIYKSVDGGKSFTSISSGTDLLSDIFFVNDNIGFASSHKGEIVSTTNAGLSWSKVRSSSIGGSVYSGIYFVNANKGWMTSGLSVDRNENSIDNWISAGGFSTDNLGLFAPSANVVYVSDALGRISKSIDGGITYSQIHKFTATKGGFLDLHFLDDNRGYASFENRIYSTLDGGKNWQPVVALGDDRIVEIHFTDASHGWACGEKGLLMRYSL